MIKYLLNTIIFHIPSYSTRYWELGTKGRKAFYIPSSNVAWTQEMALKIPVGATESVQIQVTSGHFQYARSNLDHTIFLIWLLQKTPNWTPSFWHWPPSPPLNIWAREILWNITQMVPLLCIKPFNRYHLSQREVQSLYSGLQGPLTIIFLLPFISLASSTNISSSSWCSNHAGFRDVILKPTCMVEHLTRWLCSQRMNISSEPGRSWMGFYYLAIDIHKITCHTLLFIAVKSMARIKVKGTQAHLLEKKFSLFGCQI